MQQQKFKDISWALPSYDSAPPTFCPHVPPLESHISRRVNLGSQVWGTGLPLWWWWWLSRLREPKIPKNGRWNDPQRMGCCTDKITGVHCYTKALATVQSWTSQAQDNNFVGTLRMSPYPRNRLILLRFAETDSLKRLMYSFIVQNNNCQES